jgi:hypothetical protein
MFQKLRALCSLHDESLVQRPSASDQFSPGSRHSRLADGLVGLLRLMWVEWVASRDPTRLAALVLNARNGS